MRVRYAAAIAVLLTATACSSTSENTAAPTVSAVPSAPESSAPATPTPTPEPSTETPTPEPTGASISIDCYGSWYPTYQDAWTDEQDMCDATATGEMSAQEEKAVGIAYGDEGDVESLGTLYGLCAQSGPEAWEGIEGDGDADQIQETTGMLALCPDHPDRKLLKKLTSAAAADTKLEAEGRIFWDGVYRVGKEIQPGTYYAVDVDGCYWERTNRNGNPIDNYFTNGAKRVQVTIRSSDYSFTADGCGEWRPVSR